LKIPLLFFDSVILLEVSPGKVNAFIIEFGPQIQLKVKMESVIDSLPQISPGQPVGIG
jgi:hypothetical protein